MEDEYIPLKDECEDSTNDSFESEEFLEHRTNKMSIAKRLFIFIKKQSYMLRENTKWHPYYIIMSPW